MLDVTYDAREVSKELECSVLFCEIQNSTRAITTLLWATKTQEYSWAWIKQKKIAVPLLSNFKSSVWDKASQQSNENCAKGVVEKLLRWNSRLFLLDVFSRAFGFDIPVLSAGFSPLFFFSLFAFFLWFLLFFFFWYEEFYTAAVSKNLLKIVFLL